MGQGTGPGNRGQDKTWTITHPEQPGVTREVTTREWREQKLGQAGWEKPADMPEEEAPADGSTDGSTPQ